MKKLLIMGIWMVSILLAYSQEITDELWLKAVELKEKSVNVYPGQSEYRSITKNKKGKIEDDSKVIISHVEEDGNVVNKFLSGSSSKGEISEEDELVERYLGIKVISDDNGIFRSSLSKEFSLVRTADEVIDGKEYAKYKVKMLSDNDGNEIVSNGFAWLDIESGVPYKLILDIDPDKRMIKKLVSTTYYSMTDDGYLISIKSETEIEVSVVLKKIFMTQIVSRSDFRKLNKI